MRSLGAEALWRIALAGIAFIAAIASIRDWSARAPGSHPLASLSQLWSGHPKVATEQLMFDSAKAARSNLPLDKDAKARLLHIVRAAPLEAQPFLVAGAVAQLKGDFTQARKLYRAARLRDPRAPAVRILLADLELRSGRIEEGLANLIAITRISPGIASPVVPAMAEFARSPAAVRNMKKAFLRNPDLGDAVLNELAADPANAPIIFSLASRNVSAGTAPPSWQQRLVDSTLKTGQVSLARRYWLRFNTVEPAAGERVYNPTFDQRSASPPFNWNLTSGSGGIAEFAPDGGLSIMHYGREPTLLARQLILLEPGEYFAQTFFDGSPEQGRLEWRVQCLDDSETQVFAALPQGRKFRIGAQCAGAWLDLYATPSETASQLNARLRRVELKKVS